MELGLGGMLYIGRARRLPSGCTRGHAVHAMDGSCLGRGGPAGHCEVAWVSVDD